MVAAARGFGELALGLDLNPERRLAEPGLRRERALARPQFEHLAPAPERLAHRAAPVDLVTLHAWG